jgi:hypothetical protein
MGIGTRSTARRVRPGRLARLGAITALASAAVLALPVTAQAMGAGARDQTPTTSNAAVGSATVLVSGTVTRDGLPLVGADVVAVISASAKEGTTAKIGARASTLPVSPVRTDASGAFVVRLDAAQVPGRFFGPHGDARVVIVAADSVHQLAWMVPVVRHGHGWGTTHGRTAVDSTPARMRFDLGARPFAGEAHDPQASWYDAGTGQLQAAAARPTFHLAPRSKLINTAGGCGAQAWGATYKNRTEKYRADWSWQGADWTVSQSVGEDQNLGVGFTANGVSWSQNGTAGLTTTSGAGGSIAHASDNWVLNGVNYRDLMVSCAGTFREPISVYALFSGFAYAGHPTYPYCVTQATGNFYRTSGVAITYGSAINLGPISVSSQSGFSTTSKISWSITGITKTCGSNDGWVIATSVETHKA